MPIFKVTFTDSSVFYGGDNLLNSKWTDIPDKEILCLEYFISENESIILKNYESYVCFVEATQNVYGPKGTNLKPKLENIYLMGCNRYNVTSYRISLKGNSGSDKYHMGDITKRHAELGKEFRGKPITGWHKGINKKGE